MRLTVLLPLTSLTREGTFSLDDVFKCKEFPDLKRSNIKDGETEVFADASRLFLPCISSPVLVWC